MKNKILLILIFCNLTCFQALSMEQSSENNKTLWNLIEKYVEQKGSTPSQERIKTIKIEDHATIEPVCYYPYFHGPSSSDPFKPILDLFKKLETEGSNEDNKGNKYLVLMKSFSIDKNGTLENLQNVLNLCQKHPGRILPTKRFLQGISCTSKKAKKTMEKIMKMLEVSPSNFCFQTEKSSIFFDCITSSQQSNSLLLSTDLNTKEIQHLERHPKLQKEGLLLNTPRDLKPPWFSKKAYIKNINPACSVKLLPFAYSKGKNPVATRITIVVKQDPEKNYIEQIFLRKNEKSEQERLNFLAKKIPILRMVLASKENFQ